MLNGFLKDARFDPLSNLHTCSFLVEINCIGQCVGWKFSRNGGQAFEIKTSCGNDL